MRRATAATLVAGRAKAPHHNKAWHHKKDWHHKMTIKAKQKLMGHISAIGTGASPAAAERVRRDR